MSKRRHITCKLLGLCLIACFVTVPVACHAPISPTPDGSANMKTTGTTEFLMTSFTGESVSPSVTGEPEEKTTGTTEFLITSFTGESVSPSVTGEPEVSVQVTSPALSESGNETTATIPAPTTSENLPKTVTASPKDSTTMTVPVTVKPTQKRTTESKIIATTTTTAILTTATAFTTVTPATTTTATKKSGRPITKANMVAMINEERARIGNNVRVSYGDATLQKIADIRANEQLRLFGHRRPMPCPGCDYCYGEKECLSNEAGWIIQTYGKEYNAGGCVVKGIQPEWTIEVFLENIKSSSGHYNQMFKATWTKFAYGQTAWGTAGLTGAYLYFNYGN